MDSELPANPYPINPEQELIFYVFFKESCPAEHVDEVLADFITRAGQTRAPSTRYRGVAGGEH
jgi:hypothetical protein